MPTIQFAVSSLAAFETQKWENNQRKKSAQESSGGDEGMKGDAKYERRDKIRFVKTMKIAYQQCIILHTWKVKHNEHT